MNTPNPRRQVQFSKLEDLRDVPVVETDAEVRERELRAKVAGGWSDDGLYFVVEGDGGGK